MSMRLASTGLAAFVAAVATAAAAPQARASGAPPAALQGDWEVTQVGVDENDQPHWRYEPGDPRLEIGRAHV